MRLMCATPHIKLGCRREKWLVCSVRDTRDMHFATCGRHEGSVYLRMNQRNKAQQQNAKRCRLLLQIER